MVGRVMNLAYYCEHNCQEHFSEKQVDWQNTRNPVTNDVQERPFCPNCGYLLSTTNPKTNPSSELGEEQ